MMGRMPVHRLSFAAVLLLTACSSSAQTPHTPLPTDVVATVGSGSITLAQVDEKAMQQPTGNFGSMKLSHAIYASAWIRSSKHTRHFRSP